MYDLCIQHGRVYQYGTLTTTNIYIKDGVIRLLTNEPLDATEYYDASGHLVLPGLIDPHVHFDLDLGHIRSKDDFASGTRSAAYGGVTTIIDFLAPVSTVDALKKALHTRKQEAKGASIDYTFHATVKDPKGHVKELVEAVKTLGLSSIKLFTTYSDSNRRTYEPEIKTLLQEAYQSDILVLAHIENDDMITLNDEFTYHDLLQSRPRASETTEALKLARIVQDTNTKLYMVHCSSGSTMKQLQDQFPDLIGSQFIIETCPHYLTFSSDDLNKEDGYLYTLAPPLRSKQEQELLLKHLSNVSTIGTDHCSFNKSDKEGKRLSDMPLGIGGIEHSFDIMYHKIGLAAVEKMSTNVAKIHHLYPQKGTIAVGSDADLFIYKEGSSTISSFHGNTDYSLYIGQPRSGEVLSTISRGKFVLRDGVFIPQKGKYLAT